MKTSSSNSKMARAALGILFFISSLALFVALPIVGAKTPSRATPSRRAAAPSLPSTGPNPSSGSVGPAPGGPSSSWTQGMPPNPGPNANSEAH